MKKYIFIKLSNNKKYKNRFAARYRTNIPSDDKYLWNIIVNETRCERLAKIFVEEIIWSESFPIYFKNELAILANFLDINKFKNMPKNKNMIYIDLKQKLLQQFLQEALYKKLLSNRDILNKIRYNILSNIQYTGVALFKEDPESTIIDPSENPEDLDEEKAIEIKRRFKEFTRDLDIEKIKLGKSFSELFWSPNIQLAAQLIEEIIMETVNKLRNPMQNQPTLIDDIIDKYFVR